MGLAETIKELESKGYVHDLNLVGDCPNSVGARFKAFGEEFQIDSIFRFDEMSDPGDQAILYAIHSILTGRKGTLVNGFGVYTETSTNEMVAAIATQENADSQWAKRKEEL
jgi:hypothetical protein